MLGLRENPPHTLRAFVQSSCLSLEEHEVTQRILRMADAQNVKAVIVGGAVRDWLLGLPVTDIDISVEGDGIEFARALVAAHGGKLIAHEKFQTATWHVDGLDIDVTTARTETYDYPAVLPRVRSSTQIADLSRRDFTINALALQVGEHWLGRDALLDPHGGLADLERGTLRAFHAQSFVDDPTRIFRAARYAARFGFALEPDTREWLRRGLPYLRDLSGERVKYDMELIFAEREPEKALAYLAGWDVFRSFSIPIPEMAQLAERFERVRQALPAEVSAAQAGWGAFMYHAGQLAASRWLGLIPFEVNTRDALLDIGPISTLSAALFSADVKPSARHRLLENFGAAGLALAWLFEKQPAKRESLWRELREWRAIRPRATGDDLRELGLPPGPTYAKILRRLQDARMDGEIQNDEDERRLLVLSAKS
ncbi:MAG TPA: CCA tRNA nucleotidyltransferase [Thermoflexales bacterium]|nr:CCA tRNA nucleotidyltransferase [Thermoflexales bacterium]